MSACLCDWTLRFLNLTACILQLVQGMWRNKTRFRHTAYTASNSVSCPKFAQIFSSFLAQSFAFVFLQHRELDVRIDGLILQQKWFRSSCSSSFFQASAGIRLLYFFSSLQKPMRLWEPAFERHIWCALAMYNSRDMIRGNCRIEARVWSAHLIFRSLVCLTMRWFLPYYQDE